MIKANKKLKILNFYGIKFYNWEFKKILKRINSGGYLVAPAASALSQIHKDKIYYDSIKKSSCAIFDSGFFCVLLRLFGVYNATKLSGFLFLKYILKEKSIKKKKILLINSSILQEEKNKELMNINKFKKILSYKSPFYRSNKIVDLKIIDYIQKKKPSYVIINIGGGKQEPLALYIKKNIKFKISILCLGGAIDFITGIQAPINELIDKLYLGWLLRIIFNLKIFFLRVFNSLYLIFYFKNRNYLARYY